MTLEEFEYLVDVIYAAGADGRRWRDALEAITKIVSGRAAALHITSADGDAFIFGARYDLSDELLDEYGQYYYALNPAAEPLTKVPAGVVVSDRALVPGGTTANAEYFHDYGWRHDVGGSATAVLTKNQHHLACLGVLHRWRDEPFSTQQLDILRRLTPHLQRAVDLNRRMIEMNADHIAKSLALDCLEVGMLLLDDSGRVIYTNASADAALRCGDGLSLRRKRLSAANPATAQALASLIRDAASGGDTRGGILAVPRPSGSKPYSVRVAPIPGEEGPFTDLPGRRVVVFILDPESAPFDAIETARATFKLTPAEAQLAVALGRGDDLRHVAEFRQVNISTLRAQLKAVMAKTDTNRQAELAALMARLSVLRGKRR